MPIAFAGCSHLCTALFRYGSWLGTNFVKPPPRRIASFWGKFMSKFNFFRNNRGMLNLCLDLLQPRGDRGLRNCCHWEACGEAELELSWSAVTIATICRAATTRRGIPNSGPG